MDDLLLLRFQEMDYSAAGTLLTYWPIATHAEPNAELFTRYLRLMVPGLKIAYPVTDATSTSMKALAVDEDTVFITNSIGLTEPRDGEEVPPEQMDLVFVPLLAFDTAGYRVGFGKGYYDRYLARCSPDVVTIGFSYFDSVERITDTGQFDVPLRYCITPHQIYEF